MMEITQPLKVVALSAVGLQVCTLEISV